MINPYPYWVFSLWCDAAGDARTADIMEYDRAHGETADWYWSPLRCSIMKWWGLLRMALLSPFWTWK